MLQVLIVISQKFAVEKRHGLCKSYSLKKREERRKERVLKNRQVSEVLKQWVLRCPPEKKMNKIAHVFLQLFPSLKWEICFQGA